MTLEVLFGAIYVLAVAVALWSLGQLNAFLAETPKIFHEGSLVRFKALARIQMYLALLMMVLLVAGIIAGVLLIARHGLPGFAAVILANLLVLGLGQYHKKVEVRTRSLEAGSEPLATEYRRVCETWVKKALPEF